MSGRTKGTVREFMDYLGLPKDAKFGGFCVHHESRDEFLCLYEDDNYSCTKAWSKTPENALTFGDQLEAEKVTKNINNGSVTAAIFDVGNKLLVQTM